MNGDIWLGPNAVLAFKREGYNLTDVDIKDFVDAVAYPGLRKLALKHLKFGASEMYRGFHIAAQVRLLGVVYGESPQAEAVLRIPRCNHD